ncbi:MFS transporter [Roseococcus sp. YIM B11640]|uniref:MFS transporter n=1 Tax=Roseococcus sp. YIM B11640 TaxID=3133973 RepID=UPI003C7CFB3F
MTRPSDTYRWIVVASAAAMLAIVMGQLVNGLSVFFIPLEQEFGWSRGSIALINTVGLIGVALGGIVMGRVADRAGIRLVCLVAAMAVGLGVGGAAFADQLWQFYLLFFLAGALGAGALFGPVIAAVGGWFPAGAGLAIGIASAGQAIGQGGVPFVAAYLIEALGWRGALLALGGVSLTALVPLALAMREPPPVRPMAGRATAARQTPTGLTPHRTLFTLSLAVMLCCTCMAVPLIHLVPLIQGYCIPAPEAGGVLFAMLIAAIAGRVAFGKLADVIGPVGAYLAASLWQTVGVFAFTLIRDLPMFYLFAPIYGFGYAGVMTGVLVTARALVPADRRAMHMGIILAFGWLGHALGGYQGGLFFDLTGGYTVSFANAAAVGVLNLMVVGSLLLRVRRQAALAAA